MKNLQVVFSQLVRCHDYARMMEASMVCSLLQFPIGPSWCYFHTEGLTENALLEFQLYRGRLPSQDYQMHKEMYAVCCRHQVNFGCS